MKIVIRLISTLILLCVCSAASALNCDKTRLITHPEDVLSCYVTLPETGKDPLWVITMDEHDKRGVNIETYRLSSQQWPKPAMSTQNIEWKHRLVIYRPDTIKSHQALLFVNGGTSPSFNKDDPAPLKLDFARIAAATESVVVDLQNTPQQYITFENTPALKEDGITAYTWGRFLKNPEHNVYWPIQLPMTKAVIKAMDATQQIIAQEDNFKINRFVVSGVSKRGWATWLTALSDDRVAAIVPIAINVLNLHTMLENLYDTYNQHWPSALHDYEEQHITDQVDDPQFAQLAKIVDPAAYLECANCSTYKKRLRIPKYIINASSDEFFTPDSLNNYLDKLPGENLVRIAPNQGHGISNRIIEDALLAYYETVIYGIQRPHLQWLQNRATTSLQKVTTDAAPFSARLWEAENSVARDFRLPSKTVYQSSKLTPVCVANHCEYTLDIKPPKKGWKADFVELTFQFTNGEKFILTTPAFVIGTAKAPAPLAKPAPVIKPAPVPVVVTTEKSIKIPSKESGDNNLASVLEPVPVTMPMVKYTFLDNPPAPTDIAPAGKAKITPTVKIDKTKKPLAARLKKSKIISTANPVKNKKSLALSKAKDSRIISAVKINKTKTLAVTKPKAAKIISVVKTDKTLILARKPTDPKIAAANKTVKPKKIIATAKPAAKKIITASKTRVKAVPKKVATAALLSPTKKTTVVSNPSKRGKINMSEANTKILNDMVDVIALSKKECSRPIHAHLEYATNKNFVGTYIDGYTPGLTDFALMTKSAAAALIEVQKELNKEYDLGLLIYDSYRPQRAVHHFVRWSGEPVPAGDAGAHELERKKLQYPDIEKSQMFKLGYVSDDSQHCYGHTVDLVLIDKHGKELDHGSRFDFMGTESHYTATADVIGEKAVANRLLLEKVMVKHGFIAYPYEYWHFSYKDKTFQKPIDIMITPELKGLNA
jgi:PhoPQ-activated pathogenicity-related protein/D-alanyl-D-alanine dipeptidase